MRPRGEEANPARRGPVDQPEALPWFAGRRHKRPPGLPSAPRVRSRYRHRPNRNSGIHAGSRTVGGRPIAVGRGVLDGVADPGGADTSRPIERPTLGPSSASPAATWAMATLRRRRRPAAVELLLALAAIRLDGPCLGSRAVARGRPEAYFADAQIGCRTLSWSSRHPCCRRFLPSPGGEPRWLGLPPVHADERDRREHPVDPLPARPRAFPTPVRDSGGRVRPGGIQNWGGRW